MPDRADRPPHQVGLGTGRVALAVGDQQRWPGPR